MNVQTSKFRSLTNKPQRLLSLHFLFSKGTPHLARRYCKGMLVDSVLSKQQVCPPTVL